MESPNQLLAELQQIGEVDNQCISQIEQDIKIGADPLENLRERRLNPPMVGAQEQASVIQREEVKVFELQSS